MKKIPRPCSCATKFGGKDLPESLATVVLTDMQFDINELLGRTGLYDPTLPTREINLDADSHGNGNASGIG